MTTNKRVVIRVHVDVAAILLALAAIGKMLL
jgi:hypothetical protein